MKVTVVAVGRARAPFGRAVAEYEARAARYWRLEIVVVDAGVRSGRGGPEDARRAEDARILARLPAGGETVALTRSGDALDSTGLARYLGELALHSAPGVTFVIGGAHGLGPEALARARKRLSLSALTFPHELARLVLAEQLYRAGTILRGEPYHKGDGR